ncbi:P-loop containing nucleoside triphosphate hydrolase protein [Xylariaceae sp. AK1471]|nr:P-loop containing nucleoside triphosphate hydrolase protein [Xylariaceae sp. AK1471]
MDFRILRVTRSTSPDAQPFLADEEHGRGQTLYGTEPLTDDSINDDDGSDSDDDGHMKEFRAKKLKKAGGWRRYLQDFSILWPYLVPRHDRKVQFCISVNILCIAADRALNVLVPRQLGLVTDRVLDKQSPYRELTIWLLLRIMHSDSGTGLVRELVKIPIQQFSYRQVTNAAFGHVMDLSMDFHSERDSAEVLKAVEQGEALTNVMETAISDVAPAIVDLFISFWILYWKFSVYATLAMIVAAITFGLVQVITANWNTGNKRQSKKAEREEARAMHRAIQGWQTVSYFNMFFFERRRFGEAVDKRLEKNRDWGVRDAYSQAMLELLVPTTFFVLSCLVTYDITQGVASTGDFVFLIQYWENIIWPIKYLSHNYKWLMGDLIGAERLLELFQTKPTIVDREYAIDLGAIKGRVDFKHVYFSYDPRKLTLEGVDFSAAPGETVALVGETGAGKSSIMKLLLRFYDVTEGCIEVDGHDIRDVTITSLRRVFGVVPQDPLLFNTSIMENLRYAKLDATDAEIQAACRMASIHDKIMTFPGGYNTSVGENGVKLSGGEVQRLAIARVFLKNPQVLILDEATSAVDTHTESEIQKALEKLKSGRTTFVIAHRLSTVVGVDRVIVLHEGKIVESGSHEELLKQNGRYKSLWLKQTTGVGVNDHVRP